MRMIPVQPGWREAETGASGGPAEDQRGGRTMHQCAVIKAWLSSSRCKQRYRWAVFGRRHTSIIEQFERCQWGRGSGHKGGRGGKNTPKAAGHSWATYSNRQSVSWRSMCSWEFESVHRLSLTELEKLFGSSFSFLCHFYRENAFIYGAFNIT